MKALFWYANGETRDGHVPIPPPSKWHEAVLPETRLVTWRGVPLQASADPVIRQRIFELRKSLPSVEAGLKQGVVAHYVEVPK